MLKFFEGKNIHYEELIGKESRIFKIIDSIVKSGWQN